MYPTLIETFIPVTTKDVSIVKLGAIITGWWQKATPSG